MDNRFLQAISTQPAPMARYALDRCLLFSKSEWMTVAQNRRAMLLLNWMTLFIFIRWAVDCISHGEIDWQAYQYPVTFLLFVSLFLVRILGRPNLVPYIVVILVLLLNAFVLARSIEAGLNLFSLVSRNLLFYSPPVAVANSVVFKPRLALLLNLLPATSLSFAAIGAVLFASQGALEIQMLGWIIGVVGFTLWFTVALYVGFTKYMEHRTELVEVHHLIAEMERNQKLNQENARIREDLIRTQRVQMVDSMTSTMAHEVNQPISCANNYIQAARRWLSRETPDVTEALASLDGAQSEIIRVSERVMTVRRLMQRLSSEFTSIDLVDLVDRLEGMVRRDLGEQGIVLEVRADDHLDDLCIYGCEEELIQVLMNLIANAADALTDQSAQRVIRVALAEADLGEVQIAVEDNGCGIPPEHIDRVFDRLFSTKTGGSGLGLALCKRIVANHGGTIGIVSEPGQGTQVILRFPKGDLRSGWGGGRR
ncbi:sensor histidine kinase [Novosphingobium aerophilum]|uniref:histidine kinase n=1 Tax=Novosphingobium aerophilum TaxID=2839843 RepID=A0A7X1F9G7_9SPHN|nr:HAMP domain-containing sensor histidine kinase [Novosphingobium aerophilum]MBC2652860.1 HAMP domain-containing histidine kinase [Novosphingobium aerophilum]